MPERRAKGRAKNLQKQAERAQKRPTRVVYVDPQTGKRMWTVSEE